MADLTYTQLHKGVTDFGQKIARHGQMIHNQAHSIDDDATDTSRVAEQISAMGVDSATIAETSDLARSMRTLSEALTAYASAGDTTTRAAKAACDQLRSTHDGIQEAVSRAPVDRIHDVNPGWFRQE